MIIEIGTRPYVTLAYPDETLHYPSRSAETAPPGAKVIASPAALWAALGRHDVEMIIVQPSFSAPWTLRYLHRAIFSRKMLQGRSPLVRNAAPEMLRLRGRATIVVVVDYEDIGFINRSNHFLLDRADLYFKRELPPDHWRVFTKTGHANLPTPRYRLQPRQQAWVDKLRPISLGVPDAARGLLPLAPQEKTADIFFAGRVEGSSTVRRKGIAELHALAAKGVVVDIPEAPLPLEEFYRRCAAARIVWSPEGYGWDCYRHYEAPACGSAVLINAPTIERYAPLIANEHALYYDPEPGGLTRAVRAALAEPERLARITAAGQAHVMAHHTVEAISRYVVEAGRAVSASRASAPSPGSGRPPSETP